MNERAVPAGVSLRSTMPIATAQSQTGMPSRTSTGMRRMASSEIQPAGRHTGKEGPCGGGNLSSALVSPWLRLPMAAKRQMKAASAPRPTAMRTGRP